MAGTGFSAKDVELLLEKLTIRDGPALTEDDREKLIAILNAVRAASSSSSQRPVSADAEIGDTELKDLLTQLSQSFTPGSSPGSITQINIFGKITPAPPGGGDRPYKITPAPPPPPPPHGEGRTTTGEDDILPDEGAPGDWSGA